MRKTTPEQQHGRSIAEGPLLSLAGDGQTTLRHCQGDRAQTALPRVTGTATALNPFCADLTKELKMLEHME